MSLAVRNVWHFRAFTARINLNYVFISFLEDIFADGYWDWFINEKFKIKLKLFVEILDTIWTQNVQFNMRVEEFEKKKTSF